MNFSSFAEMAHSRPLFGWVGCGLAAIWMIASGLVFGLQMHPISLVLGLAWLATVILLVRLTAGNNDLKLFCLLSFALICGGVAFIVGMDFSEQSVSCSIECGGKVHG